MTKRDVTYLDKLNELRLDITHPNSDGYSYILVEGDSDIRLFRKFFNLDLCKVEFVPGGNPKLEECVSELIKTYPLVIGIRDADFIHVSGYEYSKDNMFLTDYHDLEITLIMENEVFRAVICEYTDIDKKAYLSVRDLIIKSIENISYLKWLNQIENLELNFDLGFSTLITLPDFEVDFEEYFKRVLLKSPNAKITDFSIISEKINSLKVRAVDKLQLCNGHDFMKSLSHFIRQQGKVKSISDETVSGVFRIAYTSEFLSNTTLYESIDAWAKTNNCTVYS